ncbi:Major facilitator superfamily domain-containing protein 12 [Melipona quadrifasciata]|uniref:Major facilitator superfamily domain-containing protein 12 n=1 Tax=Melipona quadrifasciata TaxID=166423 RepID=A0A0M8ZTQ5_9HYME|nr:Major facilitator superfamily domain-containing protein 12 [Melipona quadrifasciata]
MASTEERSPLLERKLSTSTKIAYALGHIFNDLTAAMWFSYTLIYFQRVALLEPIVAGALLLLGQIIDAFMTPIFGILVDRYLRKKIWHVIGSVMIALSFPVIFGGFSRPSNAGIMLVYVLSIAVFQTGWAAVQISHLSMIPALTDSLLARADLTAIRYSAQVGAAVAVFVVTWIVLPANEGAMLRLAEQDSYKFRNIVLTLTSIGLVATVLFHTFLKGNLLENSDPRKKGNVEEARRLFDNPQNDRTYWVSTSILLRVAMLYVASRLFITLATVYLPLYIEETDANGKEALATVPLVSYLSSFVAALLLKYINKSCGTKVCVLLARHFDWNSFRCNYQIWWQFDGNYIHCRDSNREWKLDNNGYGIERDGRNNWSTNGAERRRLFDRDFPRQSRYGPGCHFYREMEVHGTSVLSKLQQRHSGSRLRPLHVFGARYVIFSFAMFNVAKATQTKLNPPLTMWNVEKRIKKENLKST